MNVSALLASEVRHNLRHTWMKGAMTQSKKVSRTLEQVEVFKIARGTCHRRSLETLVVVCRETGRRVTDH